MAKKTIDQMDVLSKMLLAEHGEVLREILARALGGVFSDGGPSIRLTAMVSR